MTDEQLRCFKVFDGETHFIAARDIDEARDLYVEQVNSDDGALLDARFAEMTRDEMCKVDVKTTIADLFDDVERPCIIAGTVD